MSNILKRIFKIGEAKANAAVDAAENPVEMTKQSLRDLSDAREKAMGAQAEVKAAALQHRAAETQNRTKAKEWEDKANTLLDRVDAKQLDEATGNQMATEAMKSQQEYLKQAEEFAQMASREEAAEEKMAEKVKMINDKIHETQNDVKIIESRAKVADATEKVNKALSSTDTDGITATIERMKEKVTATEFRAEAYAEVDNANISAETKINKILNETSPNAALEALKAKRNAAKTTA